MTPDIGDMVAHYRVRRGLSQAVLAELAGCSRQYVAQLESGKRRAPSPRIVTALADALHLRGAERQRFLQRAGLPHLSERADNWPDLLAMAREVVAHTLLPAYVHDSLWRLWGWNAEALSFFDVDDAPMQTGMTTLLDFVFHPRYRTHFVDWDHWAPELMAEFRRDARGVISLRENRETFRRLRSLPDFRRLWQEVDPAPDSAASISFRFRAGNGQIAAWRVVRMVYPGPADLWLNVVLPAVDTAEMGDAPYGSTRTKSAN
jgi:transcriptional regulator with XRE-family HTH domain